MASQFILDLIPDRPDVRDVRYVPGGGDIPEKVDLRGKWMPPVYDQKNLGSCTSQAVAALLQYTDRKVDRVNVMRSRLWIYYHARIYLSRDWGIDMTQLDSGAMLRDCMKAMRRWGCPPESDWPYVIENFATKPPEALYAVAAEDRLKSYQRLDNTEEHLCDALAKGQPVVLGIGVYESLLDELTKTTGTGRMPKNTEWLLGGHAVTLVGYSLYRKEWLVRNSWGRTWGQAGYFTLPWEYLLDRGLCHDIWTAARY